MRLDPFASDATYEICSNVLIEAERSLASICVFPEGTSLTHASLFGFGIARRAVALSSGFRTLVLQCNSLSAMPLVRMQLDTACRLYAGFFVEDHQKFCADVFKGRQINKMKCSDNKQMNDKYLVDRVAKQNPWMNRVYDVTSGYIHFSDRHIKEAVQCDKNGDGSLYIGPKDLDRTPEDYIEPMQCMLHLNLMIKEALMDWFESKASLENLEIQG